MKMIKLFEDVLKESDEFTYSDGDDTLGWAAALAMSYAREFNLGRMDACKKSI